MAPAARPLSIRTAVTPAGWQLTHSFLDDEQLLCAPELHEDCKAGLIDGGGPRSPLKTAQVKTLCDAFLQVPEVKLENALLTADPLHNKEPTLRVIVEKGGDYPVGIKGNTAIRYEALEKALEYSPFFDLSYEEKNNHKRDHQVWQEDRHWHRRVNIAQNLALTRNALLAIIPCDKTTTCFR